MEVWLPRSGKAHDAFPSGHAMHVGAVASAISWACPRSAPLAWGVGSLVAATRIVLLAYWTTDVLAGLAMGAFVERWELSQKGVFGLFHGLGPPTGRDRRPIRRLTRPRLGALPHRRRDASAREGRQEPRQAIRTDPANASSRAAADNHD
jgi:hypothetical protein